jgi:hypothetical protein
VDGLRFWVLRFRLAVKRGPQMRPQASGLDVWVKHTSVCIVDGAGKIIREIKVASEPDALLQVLSNPGYWFKRIGLEPGPADRLGTWAAVAMIVQRLGEPSYWRSAAFQ